MCDLVGWSRVGLANSGPSCGCATPLSCASLLATRADQLRQDLEPVLGVSHYPWHDKQAMIGIVDTLGAANR